MLQLSMRECIMIMINLKLHHNWWEDRAGAHMKRVGNNWRITLCMRYKKKARGEVLECMVCQPTCINCIADKMHLHNLLDVDCF